MQESLPDTFFLPAPPFWNKLWDLWNGLPVFLIHFENGFLWQVYNLFKKAELWWKHCDILNCNKWAVLEDKCNFMSAKLNIYFPDDLVYLCSFPHWAFSFCASLHLQATFCSPVISVFCDVTESKECEVKFSIIYFNRNARESGQTKASENKNYRKDDSLINNCLTKK